MKAPRYFGAILDGWLAAEHLMPADCTSYLCKRISILHFKKDVLFWHALTGYSAVPQNNVV